MFYDQTANIVSEIPAFSSRPRKMGIDAGDETSFQYHLLSPLPFAGQAQLAVMCLGEPEVEQVDSFLFATVISLRKRNAASAIFLGH